MLTIILGILLYAVCCVGLPYVQIETDIVKLWVPREYLLYSFVNHNEYGGETGENVISAVYTLKRSRYLDLFPFRV